MSTEEKDIRDFLCEARKVNTRLKFKCGKGACDDTYIVEVSGPDGCMDEEPYSRMEFDFTTRFEKEHPYYFILFVPEGDMAGIVHPLFSVGYEEGANYVYSDSLFGGNCLNSYYSENYSLAA